MQNIIPFVLGIFYLNLFSNLIFKKISFSYLFITLFIVASPIPILAYTKANYIKYYFLISLFFAIFFVIKNLFKNYNFSNFNIKNLFFNFNNISKKNILILLISLIVSFLFLYEIYPPNFRFEAHDLLYYSWLNDLTNINYEGPLRLPTAYPYILSANHLNAGSLLLPFMIFGKKINMYFSYSVKYILVLTTFTNFIFQYINSLIIINQNNLLKNLVTGSLSILLLISFYFAELDYSLSISNYPLVLIMLTLCSVLLENNNFKRQKIIHSKIDLINLIFFLIIAALITKATTFPVILLSILFFVLTTKRIDLIQFFYNINFKFKSIATIAFILNFLSWILPKSNHGTLQLSFPFCLIDGRLESKITSCMNSILNNPFTGWFVPGFKTKILKTLFLNFPFREYIYIWILCLIPVYLIGVYLFLKSKNKVNVLFGKFLICFVVSTSLSIVFLRDSISFSGAHTAHSYILAPCLTIIACLLLIQEKISGEDLRKFFKIKFIVPIMFLIIIMNNLDESTTSRRDKLIKESTKSQIERISMNIYEIKQFDDNICTNNIRLKDKFYLYLDSKGCGNNDIGELIAAIKGNRTNISLFSEKSIIRNWALPPKSSY